MTAAVTCDILSLEGCESPAVIPEGFLIIGGAPAPFQTVLMIDSFFYNRI